MNDTTIQILMKSIANASFLLQYELDSTNPDPEFINIWSDEIGIRNTLLQKCLTGAELTTLERVTLDALITNDTEAAA